MARNRSRDRYHGGPKSSHKDATKPEADAWSGTQPASNARSESGLGRWRGTG
jgi:hypothetical protein